MALISFIDEERLLENLKAASREQMIEACEPIVQEAMKEIESRLRKEIGSIVIGMIDSDLDVMRDSRSLKITVHHRGANG